MDGTMIAYENFLIFFAKPIDITIIFIEYRFQQQNTFFV